MSYILNYQYISPHILEIAWPAEIEEAILMDMMSLKAKIQHEWKDKLWDVILGYHHLSLYFKSPIELDEVLSDLEHFHKYPDKSSEIERKRWYIPVLYNGRDLDRVSKVTGQSPKRIIQLHQDKIYLLHFYGFMPGFMYLGGLDSSIHCARKETPDPLIEKGSVAIGGKQTGIYPLDSPGGWNIIGKTPISLFDPQAIPPIYASPGDQISFFSIGEQEFIEFEEKVRQPSFELDYDEIHG